jgi:hypothetical protein
VPEMEEQLYQGNYVNHCRYGKGFEDLEDHCKIQTINTLHARVNPSTKKRGLTK